MTKESEFSPLDEDRSKGKTELDLLSIKLYIVNYMVQLLVLSCYVNIE